MNGITDLTTQELINAYSHIPNSSNFSQLHIIKTGKGYRTNFPNNVWYNPIIDNAYMMCYINDKIEVLRLGGSEAIDGSVAQISNYASWMFNGATKLHTIISVLNFSVVTHLDVFKKCYALREVRIGKCNFDLFFNDSPNLSKQSVLYMVHHINPSKAFTITLHPTAYAMAINDADIKAALEKQSNISLAEGTPSV